MNSFCVLILFKITVKKRGSKSYDHIDDKPDDPAFIFGIHIN